MESNRTIQSTIGLPLLDTKKKPEDALAVGGKKGRKSAHATERKKGGRAEFCIRESRWPPRVLPCWMAYAKHVDT